MSTSSSSSAAAAAAGAGAGAAGLGLGASAAFSAAFSACETEYDQQHAKGVPRAGAKLIVHFTTTNSLFLSAGETVLPCGVQGSNERGCGV
jgi:hypothetical protein